MNAEPDFSAGPDAEVVGRDVPISRAVIESEVRDVGERLEREQSLLQRHLLWMCFGASPGLLIPMLFVLSRLGGAALTAVVLTVMVLEGGGALGAKRRIGRLETLAMELREELEALKTASE